MPAPLPGNPYNRDSNPHWYDAFNSCIHFDSNTGWVKFFADLAKPMSEDIMLATSPQVAARTLGYALIHAPSDVGRDSVAREINACNKDPEIFAGVAHLYIFGLIRIFRNPKGPTPLMSADLSPRASFEAIAEQHAQTMVAPGKTPSWLKHQLLARDNYRCVFTNKVDIPSYQQRAAAQLQLSGGGEFLQVAHIISQSLTEGIGGFSAAAWDKLQWASSAAAVLDRFAGIEVRTLIEDLDVHKPINAMMASFVPHTLFDSLELWLTPTLDSHGHIVANTYDVHLQDRSLFQIGLLRQIQFHHFTTPDGQDVAPPSSTLLRLHAACAQIAHMSGAAELLDDFYREDGPAHGVPLSRQDMSINPVGATELVRALNRIGVVRS